MALYIIGGVILIIILIFLGVFIGSRLKGKIELSLTKGGYAPGESIEGDIQLTTKKTVEGNRFYVALVGYEEIKRRRIDSDGNTKTETKKNEVYRDELDLEGAGMVTAGTSKLYSFKLNAPVFDNGGEAKEGGSVFMKAAGALASAFGNDVDRRYVWEVQARYDLKGLDLKAKRKVTISGF